MKTFYIAANWKMNKNPEDAHLFLEEFKEKVTLKKGREALFFPSFLSLEVFKKMAAGSDIKYGAQNCHYELEGAFTGEVSPSMLKATGSEYCLVGHSERRQYFMETDSLLSKKIEALSKQDITPVLCVGETLEQREEGKAQTIVQQQLEATLKEPIKILIAYEPVWAIGTGKVPSIHDINEMHNFIREYLVKKWGAVGTETPLLYGGSVKPENCEEIENVENVNGFLIGGASLKVDSYLGIYQGE